MFMRNRYRKLARWSCHGLERAGRIVLAGTLLSIGSWSTLARVRVHADQTIERIAADRACYVRLPDMPEPRYGGFGAYNPETRVLSYAGGGAKLADDISMTYGDLFAIRLDGQQGWRRLAYNGNLGYTRGMDRGCREMASVPIAPDLAVSVLGKDGCDNGRFDRGGKGGDLVTLSIGRDAAPAEVRWLPGGNASELPTELAGHQGRLTRLFGAYDSLRDRLLFGQGSFDTGSPRDTLDEVFAAHRSGHQWRVQRLRPLGRAPGPRYGSCAVYVHQPETDVDGLLVLGGKEAGQGGRDLAEMWWLDFSSREAGVWQDISERFGNLSEMGPRREGACAYDPASRSLYSWMGRASKDVPDGAKRSGGLWMVDLSELATPRADLHWERLAPDDLDGITGRRLLPSVWDPVDGRLFAIGGRNDLDELADVWAIYPEVEAARCATLDPYRPFDRASTLPTATVEPGPTARPTLAPMPTQTAPGPQPPAPTTPPTEPTPLPPGTDPPDPAEGERLLHRIYLPELRCPSAGSDRDRGESP